MTARGMQQALHWARATILERETAAASDAELLQAFLAVRSEAAFAAIIRRHGPMVFGVCKRILHEHHDAEDAFQAVFLVFIRRADSIRPLSQLGNWLYGVALKTARKTKAYLGKRRFRERNMSALPEIGTNHSFEGSEFWTLLDLELERLPAIYREVIVLCDLEGKSRREAAQLLGILDGTLSGRLARARRRLAARLSRRGVSLSGAALAASLLGDSASAEPPAWLIHATCALAGKLSLEGAAFSAAAASVLPITSGVIRAMLLTKCWHVCAILAVSIIVVGGASGLRFRNGWASAGQQSDAGDSTTNPKVFSGQALAPLDPRQQPKPNSQLEEAPELIRALREARELEWKARWKEYQAGRGDIDSLLKAAAQLTDCELKFTQKPEDRITARQAQLARIKGICQISSARFETGKTSTLDLALATNAYELARSRLTMELGEAIGSKQGRDTREIDALRVDLLKTAKAEWEAHMQEFRAGVGDASKLVSSSRRWLAAELKSTKPADVVKAYKANVDRLSGIEDLFRKCFEGGQISRSNLLEVQYAKLEAQIEYQEKLAR